MEAQPRGTARIAWRIVSWYRWAGSRFDVTGSENCGHIMLTQFNWVLCVAPKCVHHNTSCRTTSFHARQSVALYCHDCDCIEGNSREPSITQGQLGVVTVHGPNVSTPLLAPLRGHDGSRHTSHLSLRTAFEQTKCTAASACESSTPLLVLSQHPPHCQIVDVHSFRE